MELKRLFTSESVSEGHPDKLCDAISDAILDECLRQDPHSRVGCEVYATTNHIIIGGEITTKANIDYQKIAREVIKDIGYCNVKYGLDYKTCKINVFVKTQSPDIALGVDKDGAGDQGMMFGYACTDTEEYMPLPLYLAHLALVELADIRKNTQLMPYLRPDAKSQFTVEYTDDHEPVRIHTIVVSTQHDEFDSDLAMQQRIKSDIKNILLPRMIEKLPAETQKLFKDDFILFVNPTGKFVIGGPHGDTGLTGRKIVVDTYGGRGAHGGGAFSGKDSSKVDRSAAYAARHIAKNLVAAGVAKEVLVQLAYAIGVAQPVSIFINTRGTALINKTDGEIAKTVGKIFDLRPAKIIEKFGLTNPIFEATAAYGHMGRKPYKANVEVIENGQKVSKEVQFFGWELLDTVDQIKEAFDIK